MRESIVSAAAEILEETGNEDAVSLRAIARQIGITAPAIYAHFPDREAILEAVVSDAFTDLHTVLSTATSGQTNPVARLRAACSAYFDFADEMPGRYQLLFGRRRMMTAGIPKAESVIDMIGGDAFATLIIGIEDCVAASRSTSTDPVRDATTLWVGLHGYAMLRRTVPYFPWPPPDQMIEDLLARAALVNSTGAEE